MNDTTDYNQVFKGIACGCVAFFLFAVMSACAKLLTDTHSVFELVFYRNLFVLVPCLIYIYAKKQTHLFKVKRKSLLFWRVVIGMIGLLATFWAVKYLPLSTATLMFLTSTLLTPAMAFMFLKERMGWRRWAAVIVGLAGVGVLVQPSAEVQIFGLGLAILAALGHASAHVFLRALKEENSYSVTFYFFVGGVVFMIPFMPFYATPFDTFEDIALLITLSLTASIAQFFLTFAMKFAPASSVSPFSFSGLLWATVFDIIIWSYIPGWPVFLGGAMMLTAKIYILHREKVRNA